MKKKISHLEAERLRACRVELSLSKKIARAFAARNINFPRLERLQVEYLSAIARIGSAEKELHRLHVKHEFADYLRSLLTPSPVPAS